MRPSQIPSNNSVSHFGSAARNTGGAAAGDDLGTRVSARTHRNLAVRFSGGIPSSSRRSFELFCEVGEFPGWPVSSAAKRAEWTPGAPFSASTSNPESSARTYNPPALSCTADPDCHNHRANSAAFLLALPAKVPASSTTSGASRTSLSVRNRNSSPRMVRISPTLCAFRVATSSLIIRGKLSGTLPAGRHKVFVSGRSIGVSFVFAP